MTAASALDSVKNRLGIALAITTWDTIIADFVVEAVNRLSPKAYQEVAAQTVSISPDSYGEANVTLSSLGTPLDDVRLVEATDGTSYGPVDNIYRHGTTLRIRDLSTIATSAKIYGLKAFAITTVPANLELAVIWFAMSEFYDYLAGSKADYNIYMQTSGARGVDNMHDQSAYFEAKAENYLDEHATLYGSQ